MDIEANLWTTCLVLMETTAAPPEANTDERVETRTDATEIDSVVKPKKKKPGSKKTKQRE
tara:strand:- start:313 stop:492 length:180 start_codon:yes stop_codon:yes gene_type:complete